MNGVEIFVLHPRTDRPGESSRPCFFLQSQGEQLTRAGNEYRWKRHDSLTVRGNKWYRHSQSKGGGPVDFVIEFFGKSFTEAVELLTGEKGAAPPPDRTLPRVPFRLPATTPKLATTEQRGTTSQQPAAFDEDVTGFFFARGEFTRTQPTTTPYLWGGTRTEYRATPTARERRETSGSM